MLVIMVMIKIKPASCVSERCQRVQAQMFPPQSKENNEKSKEPSLEHIREDPLPLFQINVMWQRQPLPLPSVSFLLIITNHQDSIRHLPEVVFFNKKIHFCTFSFPL